MGAVVKVNAANAAMNNMRNENDRVDILSRGFEVYGRHYRSSG